MTTGKKKLRRRGLPVRFMREAAIEEGAPRLLPGHEKLIETLATAAVDRVMGPEVPDRPKPKGKGRRQRQS